MRDVNSGWAVRYAHANVASFFFIFVYAHLFTTSLNIKKNLQCFNIYCETNKNRLLIYTITNFIISQAGIILDKYYSEIVNLIQNSSFSASPSLIDKGDIVKGDKKLFDDIDFLQWFVGFSDAEAAFLINIKNNREAHFIFQITLHIDDSAVLYYIRSKLGVGIVTNRGNTCSFRIQSFNTIIETLLPIFDKFSLLTHKQLNYKDWRKSVILKKLAKEKGLSIDSSTFNAILAIKNNMNDLRTDFSNYSISSEMVSKYWLLGFIEGDGSFYFTNNRPVFSITQKDKTVLVAISKFLENLNLNPIYRDLFIPGKPYCIISKAKAHTLRITDTDILFQYIFPFFNDLTFLSRKGIDFKMWSLGLFLIIHGYHYIPEGNALIKNLSDSMNTNRYFSKDKEFLDIKKIQALFEIDPPFNIKSGKSHFILAKEFAIKKGSRLGYNLHIYKNGVEISGSPFSSYREGGKAIGLKSVSSIKNYIDTNKVFKDGITFYSSPVNLEKKN